VASRRFSQAGGTADGALLHGYRIVVVATAVGPMVEAAGGFLCDRGRAGWDVKVLLAEPCDPRPLAILGVSGYGPQETSVDIASQIRGLPRGTTVVVGAELRVEFGQGLAPIRHELSPAARAFKTHALRAAARSGTAEPVEELYRVCGESYRRLHSV